MFLFSKIGLQRTTDIKTAKLYQSVYTETKNKKTLNQSIFTIIS
jgi:hypothetical protein